ncbi:YdgH/BhsA/McbA-like domain containing protein [Pantoea sp. 1.19]|uniref:multiple stress resistance protein BhsA n=1 Tax=Pantoea sp. 1.19 TaxID=1925589 RepID=UPI0009489D04|nr:YdgH/BhsA/McbA-like domain containing protein [Pantoea sp. 1.19]
MNTLKMTLAALVLSGLSASAFAADQLNAAPSDQQPVGVVSAKINSANLTALEAKLAAKADAAGAKAYRITSAVGDNSLYGTAELYN